MTLIIIHLNKMRSYYITVNVGTKKDYYAVMTEEELEGRKQ